MPMAKILLVKSSPVRGYMRTNGIAVSPYLRDVAKFAAAAHAGQVRKDARRTPYISHPFRVASILRNVGGVHDEHVLAAAILHDTVEDTSVTQADLLAKFGPKVAGMVMECTDDKALPKMERKRLQVVKAPKKTPGAALVKIGDKIANLDDLLHSPPPSWGKQRIRDYFSWAKQVVDGLPVNNPKLSARFDDVHAEGLRKFTS